MTKSISENDSIHFNTCASYGLRGCILLQVMFVVLWGFHTKENFVAYQNANKLVLFLIAAFFLADVFTPADPRRRRGKVADIYVFFTWLVGISSLLFWGLLHCSDC
ncbi:MAG TPA: hypothetical protein VK814_03595 [Acidobacteriaceae bacterium]|jgi:hypothetical protein|nr:hypothetical protein [Acidobacteriaceae bacterium]